MKVIAVNEEGVRQEFTPAVWDTIQSWPNQGGWKRIVEPPKEEKAASAPKAKKASK